MRVLVLWADDVSTNLGVRALGAGCRELVRRVWPDAAVTYHNFGSSSTPVKVGRLRSALAERVLNRGGLQQWLSTFDLVLDTRSGDSFADIYGLRRLGVMTLMAEAADEAGVPVVMAPQTIGPFSTRLGRRVARRSLRRARLVMARDPLSAEASERLGRPADVLTTDVVFAIPQPSAAPERDIVLNVSGLLWDPNPHVDHQLYRTVVTDLAEALLATGRSVTLMPHVLESASADNDLPATRELQGLLHGHVDVVVPTSLEDVRSTAAAANLLIGSRMHACLNSLSVGTPCLPLAYSRKFAPLLAEIGWDWSIDLRTAADPVSVVLEAVSDGSSLTASVATTLRNAQALLGPAEEALRRLG